ncbi:threonine/serine exporter family protein [uncultured Clostridium sp.]|uniref:threonine/serine exporter family protein n=1 Tax=uncultured Clostridium sp. TaxID=59620 RepID=UPI0026155899|nr:threonine/serine exporter family protein [uncultured Clostridium sp.]
MDINKLLALSTQAGKLMLQSGAETYRVEETICRICESYEIDKAESFVTPTGIMVSICSNNQTFSLVTRIPSRGVDLHRIERINALSRYISEAKPSFDFIEAELELIQEEKRYSNTMTILFSALAAACFSYLFGGNYRDFIVTFFIGGIIKIVGIKFTKLQINDFFINLICAGIASLLAILAMHVGFVSQIDNTIIGSIMLLVPGLAITNAIRDTIAGDFLSGITKAFEAFLIAVSIAVGTGVVLSLWIRIFGGI